MSIGFTETEKHIIEQLKEDRTWLQKHERLIALLLVLVVVGLLGNKWLNVSADRAHDRAAVAMSELKSQKELNAQLSADSAADKAQYQAMVEQVTKQNVALVAAISVRNTQLRQQQDVDKTLPLPELAKRWQGLTGVLSTDIVAAPTGLAVTEAGARKTVDQLEQVPVLQANLKDTQAVADNRQKEVDKANSVIGGLNAQVTGLNAQVGGEQKACKEQKDVLKADARKSKKNWFVAGVITGAVIVAHFTLHI